METVKDQSSCEQLDYWFKKYFKREFRAPFNKMLPLVYHAKYEGNDHNHYFCPLLQIYSQLIYDFLLLFKDYIKTLRRANKRRTLIG